MYISQINPLSFQAEKFRLPITPIDYNRTWSGKIYDYKIIPGKYVAEYNNPKAEELYKQAQQAKDWREQARLYQEMGDYEIIDISLKAKIKEYLKNLIKNKI